jgi:hypothetical protein
MQCMSVSRKSFARWLPIVYCRVCTHQGGCRCVQSWMGSEPLRNLWKESTVTGQIKARIFDFKTRDEGFCKPCHIVRKWLSDLDYCMRCRRRIRFSGHRCVFDLNEFKATLSTAGTIQSKSLASCTSRLCGVALQLDQYSSLLYTWSGCWTNLLLLFPTSVTSTP